MSCVNASAMCRRKRAIGPHSSLGSKRDVLFLSTVGPVGYDHSSFDMTSGILVLMICIRFHLILRLPFQGAGICIITATYAEMLWIWLFSGVRNLWMSLGALRIGTLWTEAIGRTFSLWVRRHKGRFRNKSFENANGIERGCALYGSLLADF